MALTRYKLIVAREIRIPIAGYEVTVVSKHRSLTFRESNAAIESLNLEVPLPFANKNYDEEIAR